MKRVLLAFCFMFCFSSVLFVKSAAASEYDGYLTLDLGAVRGVSAEWPYVADTTSYFNVGITGGGNFLKYLGFEAAISVAPSSGDKTSTDLYIDWTLLLQQGMNSESYGFRPYIGIGLGTEFAFGGTTNMYGIGLNAKAGIRYFYKHFLIGMGIDYNLYGATITYGSYSDSTTHSNMRFGLEVGAVF